MGALKVKDQTTGLWVYAGTPGPPGPEGPQGEMGVSSVIVGDFGAITTPADLPPDGLLPVDFDGPGSPAAAYQMLPGQSLYYDKPGDPIDGHLFQFVGTAVIAEGWLDIGLIQGPQGPQGVDGPEGPMGPPTEDVHVGPDSPPLPQTELWFDTDDTRLLTIDVNDLPHGMVADVQPNEMSITTAGVTWATITATGLPPNSSRRFMWILTPQQYGPGTGARSFSFGVPGTSTGGREYIMPAAASGGYPGMSFTVIGKATTDAAGSVVMALTAQVRNGTTVTFLGNGGGVGQRSRIQVFDMGTR